MLAVGPTEDAPLPTRTAQFLSQGATTTVAAAAAGFWQRIVGQPSISFMDELRRPTILGSVSWTNGTSFDGELFSFNFDPGAIDVYAARLRGFQGWRGDVVFRVDWTGSPTTFGKLIVHAFKTPEGNAAVAKPHIASLVHATCSGAVNPSETGSLTLVWKFRDRVNFYDVSSHDALPYVRGVVFNPLRSVTASSPTVNLQVYAHIENFVPMVRALPQSAQTGEIGEGVYHHILAASKGVGRAVREVALAGGSALLGATKPQLLPTHAPTLTSWIGDMTHANGNDYSVVLAADANNSVATNTSVGFGQVDDTSLARIAALPGYVGTYLITPSSNPGDTIFSITVNPISRTVADAGYVYTPAGFCALAFQRYRGRVQYCVEFVSTPFQRCTVQLAHRPNSPSSSIAESQQYLYNDTIVVDGSRCVKFDIPWVSSLTHTNPSVDTPDLGGLGYLILRIVNPVVSNQAQPGAIYVNVTVSLLDAEFVRFAPRQDIYPYQAESALEPTPCAELAYGERFSSLNQMTRYYQVAGVAEFTGGGGWGGTVGGGIYDLRLPLDPRRYPGTNFTRAFKRTLLLAWASAFYGCRGSLRIKIPTPFLNPGAIRGGLAYATLMNEYQPYSYEAYPLSSIPTHDAWLYGLSGLGGPRVLLDTMHNIVHEVTVPNNLPFPFWSMMSLDKTQVSGGSSVYGDFAQTVKFYGQVAFSAPKFDDLSDMAPDIPIFLAGGDDFEMFDFMWVPVLFVDE